MADIRINALPTTATDFASDDYIAIDGTTNGTRKLNAKTANLTFSDVTLGSSGPSVKSSLSARAPRQGLVFDGTAGATISSISVGTSDFTFAAWINPTTVASASMIVGSGANPTAIDIEPGGTLRIQKQGTSVIDSTSTISSGKFTLISYTRSGTTGTWYINGIASGTGSDSTNYNAFTQFGDSGYFTSLQFKGVLIPLIYNRALSASEVVALYEAGAPAGADYNSASNTAVNVATTVNASSFNYDTFSGASASGFTAVKTNTTAAASAYSGTDIPLVVGQRLRVSFTCTLTSGTLPVLYLSSTDGALASGASSQITAGANVIEMTCTVANSAARVRFFNGPANPVNYTISSLSITRIGLLLAPDAAQAGGGLTWYDTSGNAANITLPASGVSWNVPSSRVLGGNWSATGNFLIGTSTASGVLTINKAASDTLSAANAAAFIGQPDTFQVGLLMQQTLSTPYSFALQVTRPNGAAQFPLTLNPSGGNVLIGTTIDGGQKLQVNGTAAISGGIVGTTTNDSAAAGIVGQYAETSTVYGSRITLTTDTVANVASVSLTAGDWDVSGNVELEMSGVTSTDKRSGISTTSASLTNNPDTCGAIDLPTTTLTGYLTIPTPTVRISIASTTTVYLPTKVTFSAGTTKAWGIIRARRVR